MTNNPDSKAPDRMVLQPCPTYGWDHPDRVKVETEHAKAYIHATPQQAAKVLFESMMGDDYQMSATTMDMFLDALHSETNRAKMFFAALKALAESKE